MSREASKVRDAGCISLIVSMTHRADPVWAIMLESWLQVVEPVVYPAQGNECSQEGLWTCGRLCACDSCLNLSVVSST